MDLDKLKSLQDQYREALLKDVAPFWMKYSPDRKYGGYLTCLDRDGTVFNEEKMMWMQWRAVWMFSVLYRQVEAFPEWLECAKLGVDFLLKHGRDEQEDWYFLLGRDGIPYTAAYNIFSDFFAVLGLAQYGAAKNDEELIDLAEKTYRRILERFPHPKGQYEKRLPSSPKLVSHAPWMILLSVSGELNAIRPYPLYEQQIESCLDWIMNGFLDRNRWLLFENITPERNHPDTPAGRLLNPGHAIESMWFVLEAARRLDRTDLILDANKVILKSLETGWDEEFGGIYAFLDSEGRPPEPLEWHMKLWWPHTETLYALLLGYHLTGNADLWHWFEKVHDYTWSHFPDPEYGEWFGYLDRQGKPTHFLKGSKWKGFYHVPRGLLLCSKVMEEIMHTAK